MPPEALPVKGRVLIGLRELLSRAELAQGDPLPSERSLASSFGVDRKTIRVALGQLEREGLIAERGGRRQRVVGTREEPFRRVLSSTVALLSEYPLHVEAFHISRGWDLRIQLVAMERLHQEKINVLAFHPDRFAETSDEALATLRPAGVVMFYGAAASSHGQRLLKLCQRERIPAVIYGGDATTPYADRVVSDHEAGAYQLTRWLISQGKQRILPVWRFTGTTQWLIEREMGYRRAMEEAGLQPLTPLRTPDLTQFFWSSSSAADEAIFADLARVLLGFLYERFQSASPPDAIMVATDPHAYHVNAALRLMGRKPGEIPVVGYDNSYRDIIEQKLEKWGPAATMDKQNDLIGRAMCDLLIDRIHNRLPSTPQVRKVEPALHICPPLPPPPTPTDPT